MWWYFCSIFVPTSGDFFYFIWNGKKNGRVIPNSDTALNCPFYSLQNFTFPYRENMVRYSSVGIATRYGLDGPGIESRLGRDFPHPSRPALGTTQPPVQWVLGLLQRVKRPMRGADHPPPSKCRGHERVGLYLYTPSGPSWSVIGGTLRFYLHHVRKKNRKIGLFEIN